MSNTNEWNCPCGHLDFNETCKDCAIRETYEETGVKIDKAKLHLFTINDHDFESSDQSIGFLYYALIEDKTIENIPTSKSHMETNEVKEIQWINVDELSNYNWAFNHNNRILQILNYINN